VFFDNVEVPFDALLGAEGQGWSNIVRTLNHERVTVAAICIGNARAAQSDAVRFASEREAFGRAIGAFQVIQHKLADSYVDIELSQHVTYAAARAIDSGMVGKVEATMAKLVASESAFRVASRSMDVFAGQGFIMESDVQRHFRDSRQMILGPITNEMARNVIGEAINLPRSY
jgi:acyl-CoA dehydrogenase